VFCSTARCTTPTLCSIADETAHDLPPINQQANDDVRSDSGAERATLMTSSSPTLAAIMMANGKVPATVELFKRTIITEDECRGYHDLGWLPGHMMSSILEVEFPTVDDSNVMCFESHLVAGLGLPPSKFLVANMSYVGYRLIHFNPNTVVALSCFTMLCKYWLGIAPDTSLFWYNYSPAQYRNVVYSENGHLYVGTVEMSILRMSSRAVGRVPNSGGSW
jgi:hypothetical protein